MVYNNPDDASLDVCSGLHSPGSDRSSDLDYGSLVHPIVMRDIVLILWLDAHSGDTEWTAKEDWENVFPTIVQTVGFLVHEAEAYVEVVQCIGMTGEREQRLHSITIPRSCMLKFATCPNPLKEKLDI